MQKPTKAFIEMLRETADKLQGVVAELYPQDSAENIKRTSLSPTELRSLAAEYEVKINAENAVIEQVAQHIASKWQDETSPNLSAFLTERSREIARHIAADFDIKPKARA